MISMLPACLIHFPLFGLMVIANASHAIIDLPVLTSWRTVLSLSLSLVLRWNQHLFIPGRSAIFFQPLWNIWLSAPCFFSYCFARTMSEFTWSQLFFQCICMDIVLRLMSLDLWMSRFQVRLRNEMHVCFDVEDALPIETIGSPNNKNPWTLTRNIYLGGEWSEG